MTTVFRQLEQFILKRYASWLDRRVPPRRSITLVQDNIFIYPNWQFVYYFICAMLMWVAATNYENNLAFALAFLMLSVFVVCIHHTYNNVAGLTLTAVRAQPVFAGEYTEVEIQLQSGKNRQRDSLRLFWHPEHSVILALLEDTQLLARVPLQAERRGWYKPGRLTIDTVYPLGIIRAVSYVDLEVRILVYPKPQCYGQWLSGQGQAGEGDALVVGRGSEEFSHLEEYQPGASLKRVAWKQVAKGRDLQVKEYGDFVSRQVWLEWDQFPGLGIEERLSTLCYWALEFDRRQEYFGLRLPGVQIDPGSGDAHRLKVLSALALHGVVT